MTFKEDFEGDLEGDYKGNFIGDFKQYFTPLLNGPISKNYDQRSGILHIVRDS